MKYTKSIVAFLFLNLLLVFSMIFIANKTREIEKNKNILKIKISKVKDDVKINKIELMTHQNSSYLKKLYSIYFDDLERNNNPNLVLLKEFSPEDRNMKLVKTNN